MRLVAFEIADRSPDPDQAADSDRLGDSIRSRVLLQGHVNRKGEYVKGLTDYTGLEPRAVSRALQALAEAGYEMRIQLTGSDGKPVTDKKGRPLFACEGRSMRFRIPPVTDLPAVENPEPGAPPEDVRNDTLSARSLSETTPSSPQRVSITTPVFPTKDLSLFKTLPNSSGAHLTTSVEGRARARGQGRIDEEAERRRQIDELSAWMREHEVVNGTASRALTQKEMTDVKQRTGVPLGL